jgi:hypothetical protein
LLGGDSEEAVRKSQLSPNGAFAHSVDLAFSDHDHRLESFDGPPRRLETKETESGIDSPFDEPMVLLDEARRNFYQGHGRIADELGNMLSAGLSHRTKTAR